MDRREAVKSVAFLIGGALSATTMATLFESCNEPGKTNGKLFTADQQKIIDALADVIMPETEMSPGATAANVGPFISMMIADCYTADDQKAYVKGLVEFENRSQKTYKKSFTALDIKDRNELTTVVRDEIVAANKAEKEKNDATAKQEEKTEPINNNSVKPANIAGTNDKAQEKPALKTFFELSRDLTMLGFFSSEVGATKAYEYIAIPGRYEGCVDLKPGQRLYA